MQKERRQLLPPHLEAVSLHHLHPIRHANQREIW